MLSSFWYSDLFISLFHWYIVGSLIACFHVICVASAAHAILFLVLLFILVSFIFILLGTEYVGLMFIIVYVGAIAVLFLFIVMLLDLRNLLSQGFRIRDSLLFTWTVMLTSDIVLYNVAIVYLPIFGLPLVPVSRLIDFDGNTVALHDNLLFISPELFNIYPLYVVGCGFILTFVMVGVVCLVGQSVTVAKEKIITRNKMVVDPVNTVFVQRSRHGI